MDIVENKDLIETLSYLTVILSALIGAVIYLIKRYRNYEKYLDSVFTGHWVNEGRIDGINENTHSIDLYLESKNKSMIGTANLFKFDNSSSINIINVILDGHLRITYKIDNRDDLEDIVNYLVAVLKP